MLRVDRDHHRVPATDPFSWTHEGREWVAHEWLAEVIIALADRAGGYAIQGLGSTLVERLHGDFSNVVGLPLKTLLELEPALLA